MCARWDSFGERRFLRRKKYEELFEFARNNGQKISNIDQTNFRKTSFLYGDYTFELLRDVGNTKLRMDAGDYTSTVHQEAEYYNIFRYTVYTGKEAYAGEVVKESKKNKGDKNSGKK